MEIIQTSDIYCPSDYNKSVIILLASELWVEAPIYQELLVYLTSVITIITKCFIEISSTDALKFTTQEADLLLINMQCL